MKETTMIVTCQITMIDLGMSFVNFNSNKEKQKKYFEQTIKNYLNTDDVKVSKVQVFEMEVEDED